MTGPLRVLVAPDKFKGTLTAVEAAAAIAAGVRAAQPDAQVMSLPVADGGEGSVAAAIAAGARPRATRVRGPLGAPVIAHWAVLDGTAIVELAEASGLQHVADAAPEHALAADTRGVGQLIRAALDEGIRSVLVAVGGSATSDGGFGAMVELGLRVYDDAGAAIDDVTHLDRAAQVEVEGLDARLAECRVVVATDVISPLTGPGGAARVFAPQKGADEAAVRLLERRLEVWGRVLAAATGRPVAGAAGTGAAGGFAAPLLALGIAEIRAGADEIAALVGFDEALARCDVVVVGEGSLDGQSLQGKGPVALARRAALTGATVVALCGRCALSEAELAVSGISRVESLVDNAATREEALVDAAAVLRAVAARVFAAAILPDAVAAGALGPSGR